eukprot:1157559-Pelagomonas_calceolata.AAC.4
MVGLAVKLKEQHNYVGFLECAQTKIPPMSSEAMEFIQRKKAEEATKAGAKIAVGMATGGGTAMIGMMGVKATGAALGGLLGVIGYKKIPRITGDCSLPVHLGVQVLLQDKDNKSFGKQRVTKGSQEVTAC